ncbi:unnamed protein product [Gordionus sp. m RMFG-2023]
MYRGDQKVLERERDIERVYYPNESFANNATLSIQNRYNQQPIGQQAFVTTTQLSGPPPSSNLNPQQISYITAPQPPSSNINQTNKIATIDRNNRQQSYRSNRSECRSCSVCSSSDRSIAARDDNKLYYKEKQNKRKKNMLSRSFPLAALVVGLLICISFINWVGIWSPFWALARNPFLIYPVTSTTTVNTGVAGVQGSGLGGGPGEIPVLLNPQTIQPPGGRIGIGNPIFGHLGIWAYCAPRSFCVTYPYGRSRPYGFFSAAAFSLSLAGLGGFFTQLFGGPLLSNLVGGLGFGGGLGGALGPGFSGIGGFGGGVFKRSIPEGDNVKVIHGEDVVAFNMERNRRAVADLIKNRHRAPSDVNDNTPNNGNPFGPGLWNQGNNNDGPRYGLNPQAYKQQTNAKVNSNSNPSNLAGNGNNNAMLPPGFPFAYFYDPASPNGIRTEYVNMMDKKRLKQDSPNFKKNSDSPNALIVKDIKLKTNSIPKDNPSFDDKRSFRQVDYNPNIINSPNALNLNTNHNNGAGNIRNNRNLGLINSPIIDAGGRSLMTNQGFGGINTMGLGGLGALGLGGFGNRFGGLGGLLGSQQALTAFALLQPGPEGLPLPENFLFSLPGSLSPFAYFRNRVRENIGKLFSPFEFN